MKNIYLIGMPGCGKTTVSNILAKNLNMAVADTDQIIESKYGTISDIFSTKGESYFRELETKVLKEIGGNTVVSTGGGIVKSKENGEIMKQGVIVFIDVSPEVLKSRNLSKNRPLLKSFLDIQKLYNERYELYKSLADITVIGDNGPLMLAKEIAQNIKEK